MALVYNKVQKPKKEEPLAPGRVINMEDVGDRREYIYPSRPESTYMKDGFGDWFIKNPSTKGHYIAVKDPDGSRTARLNLGAQVQPTKLRMDEPIYGESFFAVDKPYKPELEKNKNTEPKGFSEEYFLRQQFKESSFNPKAKSPAGAAGLAQIMPNVKADAVKAGIIKKSDDLYDPKVSAKIQKWYMNDLYNASFINVPNQSDKVRLAKSFSAYNWGRGNLLNYLNKQKEAGVDIYNSEDWINNLPEETKDYVVKILYKSNPEFEKQYSQAAKTYKFQRGGLLYNKKSHYT